MMGTVTEHDRMMLRQWAQEHMGEPTAEVLMKCTAPKGWDDIASASDVAALRQDIKNMEKVLTARFRAELATEVGKVHEKVGEVHAKIGEVHAKIGDVGRMQSWQMVTLIVAVLLAVFGPTVVERVFPPSSPQPSQVVIQSPGQ